MRPYIDNSLTHMQRTYSLGIYVCVSLLGSPISAIDQI